MRGSAQSGGGGRGSPGRGAAVKHENLDATQLRAQARRGFGGADCPDYSPMTGNQIFGDATARVAQPDDENGASWRRRARLTWLAQLAPPKVEQRAHTSRDRR